MAGFQTLADGATGVAQGIKSAFVGVFDTITLGIRGFSDALSQVFSGDFSGAADTLNNLFSGFSADGYVATV